MPRFREGRLDTRRFRQAPFALFLQQRGWTQERIARELGCSKSTVVSMLRYMRESDGSPA